MQNSFSLEQVELCSGKRTHISAVIVSTGATDFRIDNVTCQIGGTATVDQRRSIPMTSSEMDRLAVLRDLLELSRSLVKISA